MSGASLAWIAATVKAERKAEREGRTLARKARTKAPSPAELGHVATVPRYRWPAAFAALEAAGVPFEAAGVPFLSEAHPTEHAVTVRTTGAGRATLDRFEGRP